MGCVYLIRGPGGKGYIGITKHDADTRWKVHHAEHRCSTWSALHGAMRKYGPDKFTITTLFESDDWNELCRMETEFITTLQTKCPSGYNLTDGGEGSVGHVRSQETKDKIRAKAKARWSQPEFKARFVALANDPDYRERIDSQLRGQKRSPQTVQRMTEARRRRA